VDSRPTALRLLTGAAATVIVVAGLHAAADLLGPVLLALVLTIAVAPISRWLRGRGLRPWAGIAASAITASAILVGLGLATAMAIGRLVDLLPSYQPQFEAVRADVLDGMARLGLDGLTLGAVDPGRLAGALTDVIGGITGAVAATVFVVALLFFLAVDAAAFPAQLDAVAGRRPDLAAALRSFAGRTRRYLVLTTVFGLIVAVVDTIGLWALGVPVPLVWGLLSFVTNYIPNVGFVIGLVPPALLGLLAGGPGTMVAVIVLYSVANLVIQSLVQPVFVGDAVGLPATVSFLSLVFWAWVLGPVGALLAVPLSLLARALLLDADPATRWVADLFAPTRAR
jgi:predicted PurR-regulated permease PerM